MSFLEEQNEHNYEIYHKIIQNNNNNNKVALSSSSKILLQLFGFGFMPLFSLCSYELASKKMHKDLMFMVDNDLEIDSCD